MKQEKKSRTLAERYQELRALVTELHEEAGVVVRPLYPFTLVRVLDRERKQGMIILPENQKKTTIEGIVLDVFPSFWKHLAEDKDVFIESALTPGDHILFPHFEGIPVPLDGYTGDFRLVPEIFAHYGAERNGVIATIDYEVMKTHDWLRNEILKMPDANAAELATRLMESAEIFPRNRQSLTQSAIGEK